jgi:hypothetical protein
MTQAPLQARAPARRRTLDRTRALPAPVRHAGAAALVGGMAALPLIGMPVVPEGRPFLLVWAILAAAVLFGRATALSAALVATALGAGLLMPSAGAPGVDAVRTGLSLVAFLVVALGISSAVEAMRRVYALMEGPEDRRRDPALMPVPVPVSTRPAAMRLLMMTPEERRCRLARQRRP